MSEREDGAGEWGEEPVARREVPVREVDFGELEKGPGGCGLKGCLYGTVGFFALLLIAMIFILLTRVWITPAVQPGMGIPR